MSDWSKKFTERVSKLGKKILHPGAEETTAKRDPEPASTPQPPEPEPTTAPATAVSPIPESKMSDTRPPREKTTDIGKQQIGKVYAQALLDAAGSSAAADDMLSELGGFVNDVFAKAPKLEALIGSPRISSEEKIGMLDKMLNNRVSPGMLKFLKVVCSHGRLDCLRAIYNEACALQNDRKGVVEIEMVTAEAADTQVVSSVKQALAAKMGGEVDLRTSTDPSLIGGVMVRVGDKVLDASIKQKLKLIRDQAVATAAQNIRQNTTRFEN